MYSSQRSAAISQLESRNKKKQRQLGQYKTRRAVHSGSWYSDSQEVLDEELSAYLTEAKVNLKKDENSFVISSDEKQEIPIFKAIIAPHAGFSYSGPTAAYAYTALTEALLQNSNNIKTILVLHPSHHVYLDGCAISGAKTLATPLGDLVVDDDLREELYNTGHFEIMEKRVDENEHSGEMQYPYISKAISSSSTQDQIKVLPIMVGALSSAAEEKFGKLLCGHIIKPEVFTVISSDFCHWGTRFSYTPYEQKSEEKKKQIFEYISWLDHSGMEKIEMQDPGAFTLYLRQTRNTICGRHPINVWLQAIKENKLQGNQKLDIEFVRYAQSSQVKARNESSVSYASAVARVSTSDS